MSVDSRIDAGLRAMLQSIEAPEVPFARITEKMKQRPVPSQATPRNARRFAAAAAAALIVAALPLISPAVVQSFRDALQTLGGIAPPRAPQSVMEQLKPQRATLAAAQSRVSFKIVPPSGLPKDAVLSTIVTTPTGVLDKRTGSWRIGPVEVSFFYRRSDGRDFVLVADPYDAHGEQPGRYVFEEGGRAPDGRPILIKHRQFAWRNGDQEMRASESSSLRAAEIRAIRSAMRGTPVALRRLHAPNTSATRVLRVIVKP